MLSGGEALHSIKNKANVSFYADASSFQLEINKYGGKGAFEFIDFVPAIVLE